MIKRLDSIEGKGWDDNSALWVFTSDQLESRAEDVQRADEEVEESEQQNELHNGG